MAKKVSSTAKKIISKSVSKHKGDETNYGVVNLPGGIENGIARLNDCKIDTYKSGNNEGEYYFLANGIVHSPDKNNKGVPIKGLRTQIMIPLCDTKKANGEIVSIDDHVQTVLNEIRKLGYDTSEMDDDGLEDVLEELKEVKPFFRFSTSQSEPTDQYPNPRVWENWHGVRGLEDYEPEEDDDEVEEDEEVQEEEEEEDDSDSDSDDEEEEEIEQGDGEDLGALAEAADSGDEDAEVKLTELAEEANIDPDEYETWAEVVEAMEPEEESEEEEDEESEEEEVGEEEEGVITPEKEEIYYYKPPNKRKKVEVEVTAVFKSKETCNLRDLENEGKTYRGVAWSDLSNEAE